MRLRWLGTKLRFVIDKMKRGLNHMGWPMYGGDMDHWTYRYGKCVAVTGDLKKDELEKLCRDLRMQTGQRVDWHWMGGRGVIKCLGKPDHVRQLISERPSGIQRYPFD